MNLYELFILGVNIKYIVFSILYRHINVSMACKEKNKGYMFDYQKESYTPSLVIQMLSF